MNQNVVIYPQTSCECLENNPVPFSTFPNTNGIKDLNPQVYTSKTATDFVKMPYGYITFDPRLKGIDGQVMPLDKPPITGKTPLRDMYDESTPYPTGYQSYEDIRDGDIMYYIDKSIQNAFYSPIYSCDTSQTSQIYIDPMGSVKPEYNRVDTWKNPMNRNGQKYFGCLSSISDSQFQRDDLIALQQRKWNQSRYSSEFTEK